jgi:hypothetical protein
MGKVYEDISPELADWIAQQHLFFVATAPLSREGHVNTSPKGLDCLRIVGRRQVAYVDLTGSGAETIAHLRENGRIVLMFCAFTGPPKIIRLHGMGTVITKTSSEWSAWCERFPTFLSTRSIIVVDVTRVSDSCGFGVPKMDFTGDRDTLTRWAETKGSEALPPYRRTKNVMSIDGLPALESRDA